VPSRRTIALNQLLEERSNSVYPQEAGYAPNAVASVSVSYQPQTPQRLPDALMPKQWAFVSLTAGDLQEMSEWDISFAEAFPMPPNITAETPIPGVILFSGRALAIAGWMSGIELAFWKYIPGEPARLILETGSSDSWILANLKNKQLIKEAEGFEAAKQQADRIHFLAVQSDRQSQSFAGFWLLQELYLA
jgi:hypothetical protein